MRNDERLRTIYEVMAPYIVRSERNWREYLSFASRFHKQSFDNILLVYAQDEATEKIEALTQQMLQQDPMPQTEDILERTRHLNDLKLMAEETVLQTIVLIPR